MTQRLVWNFELSASKTPFLTKEDKKQDDLKWEWRFFWPEEEIIRLPLIDDAMLDLAHYEQKHKKDHYYLLPGEHFNIKLRRNELLYKPLLKQGKYAQGFGAKIHLEADASKNMAPSTMDECAKIKQQINEEGVEVVVKKESFTFKLPTHPSIKLELARIEVRQQIYFSVCVEGRSHSLVETVSKALFGKQASCDYVTFLKTIVE